MKGGGAAWLRSASSSLLLSGLELSDTTIYEPQIRALLGVAQVSDADQTRLLVEESWALVEQDLEANGVAFFLKIFEIAPAALPLFSFKGEICVVACVLVANSSVRHDARGQSTR